MAKYRMAKQVPWYHQNLPRCQTITQYGEQCINSARWTDVAREELEMCKPHARMCDFPVKLIRPRRVRVR